MPKTTRLILTGVPPYDQNYVINDNGKTVMAGCGPVAALMLLAYYDRAFGYHRLIKSVPETKTGMPEELILKLRAEMKTSNFELDKDDVQTYGLTLPPAFRSGLKCKCGQPIWVIGSAEVGFGCFTCITGETYSSGDYELEEACNVAGKAAPKGRVRRHRRSR